MDLDIQCLNIKKTFGELVALDYLNHTFEINKIHGIMGHNGAGKTTLLRMIGGIIQPTSGTIKVGENLDVRLQPEEIKKITGFLPETAILYKKLTAKEFLEFIGKLRGLNDQSIEEKMNHYFEIFEFSHPHKQMQDLSRGLQQKVLLIAALMHEPLILLLDEPIATLDPMSAIITRENIKRIAKKGRNILIASHIPEFIEKTCDDVILLREGKVMETGDIRSILKKYNADCLEEAYLKIMTINK